MATILRPPLGARRSLAALRAAVAEPSVNLLLTTLAIATLPVGVGLGDARPATRPTITREAPSQNLLLTTLAGQDRIYGAPGQAPDVTVLDRPTWRPRGPASFDPPNLLATTLRGQDTFFGSPGQAPDVVPDARPRREIPRDAPVPNLLATTLATVPTPPFFATTSDLSARAVPRRGPLEPALPPNLLLTTLLGQDVMFGGAGQPLPGDVGLERSQPRAMRADAPPNLLTSTLASTPAAVPFFTQETGAAPAHRVGRVRALPQDLPSLLVTTLAVPVGDSADVARPTRVAAARVDTSAGASALQLQALTLPPSTEMADRRRDVGARQVDGPPNLLASTLGVPPEPLPIGAAEFGRIPFRPRGIPQDVPNLIVTTLTTPVVSFMYATVTGSGPTARVRATGPRADVRAKGT